MNLQGNEMYIRSANNYVDEGDAIELRANVFKSGTIVFPKVGAAIATNKKRALTMPTIIDNNLMGVSVSDTRKCNHRFLRSWFESIDLTRLANLSGVPSITSTRLKSEFLLLPPLDEQLAIADVLDSIDEVCQRTEAMVSATERLRDSLLHELLSRGIPGLHTDWAAVAGIGSVPVCWNLVPLRETARLGSGEPPQYAPDDTGDVDVLGANGRIGSTFRPNAYRGIAVGRVGASGSVRRVREPVWLSDNVLLVEPSPEVWDDSFVYRALSKAQLSRLATKTAQPLLTQTALGGIRIPQPSLEEQQSIAAVLDGVEKNIERTRNEDRALRAFKESTAASLLSGHIRILRTMTSDN